MPLTAEERTNIEAWVAALRSGKYLQTIGGLRDRDGFCCLGVACDLFIQQTGNGGWDTETYINSNMFAFTDKQGYKLAVSYLPEPVREWLGMISTNPIVRHPMTAPNERGSRPLALSSLNDKHVPFSQIADAIEATFLNESIKE